MARAGEGRPGLGLGALAVGAALALSSGPALAQGGDADDQGRVVVRRDQGQADALAQALRGALDALRAGPAGAERLGAALAAWRPDAEVVRDLLRGGPDGPLGKAALAEAEVTFAGAPAEVAARLGLRPDLAEVEVFEAWTEDLATMQPESVAAREFASGLRWIAKHLPARYRWYVAVLRPKGSDEAVRLQVFAFSARRWVYLGRLWRLDAP